MQRPVVPPVIGHPPHPTPPRQADGGLDALSILVADPYSDMLKLIREILIDKRAHRVIGVTRAEDALLKLQSETFDLVIADAALPEIDGIELTRQIRDGVSSAHREKPVLLTMTLATTGRIRDAREAGVDEILLKPLTITSLTAKVLAAVYGRRRFLEAPDYAGPDRRRDALRAPYRETLPRKTDQRRDDIIV